MQVECGESEVCALDRTYRVGFGIAALRQYVTNGTGLPQHHGPQFNISYTFCGRTDYVRIRHAGFAWEFAFLHYFF